MEHRAVSLTAEEILDRLITNLTECNRLVSILGQKAPFDREELRKLRNDLMFARSKTRNLIKAYEEMQRPVDSFRLSARSIR